MVNVTSSKVANGEVNFFVIKLEKKIKQSVVWSDDFLSQVPEDLAYE